jgi:hypothetical protein
MLFKGYVVILSEDSEDVDVFDDIAVLREMYLVVLL